MKFQKLENQEAYWKWQYLLRKYRNGEAITKYKERSLAESISAQLFQLENDTQGIEDWVKNHLNPDLINKLSQAQRARRKRFFDAEHQHTTKKSINLDFIVWKRLAECSKQMKKTLSETIIYMIEEQEKKQLYANKVSTMKNDLLNLINKKGTKNKK